MKNLATFLLAALIVIVAGCSPQQTEPATSTPAPVSTATQALPTPSPTAPPPPTATATPPLPRVRRPQVREPLPVTGSVEFHILHWNDLHGELIERYNEEDQWVPGVARMAAYINTSLADYGRQNTLLLDGGDWFENGAIQGDDRAQRGRAVLSFYQWLGVDAITVGNHELFLDLPYFLDLVRHAAPVEMLSVNFRKIGPSMACDDDPILNAYKIFELGEPVGPRVRVAVMGVSMGGLQRQAYVPIEDICFTGPLEEIEKIYDELMEKEKPDVLVLVSHSGLDLDQKLAAALNADGKPVDVIIGGHSHTRMDAPDKVGGTTIVQAWDLGRAVGDLDLVYDRAAARLRVKYKLVEMTASSPQDPQALEFVEALGYVSAMPTPVAENPEYTYLISMQPVSQSVGFWSLGQGIFPATDTGMTEGQPIYSHRKEYARGLFAHSPSDLRYALDGKFTSFVTEVGLKETACGDGASFSVLLDGRELYASGVMMASDDPQQVSVDVAGGKLLELKTVPGAGNECDWTIWGDPYLVPAP